MMFTYNPTLTRDLPTNFFMWNPRYLQFHKNLGIIHLNKDCSKYIHGKHSYFILLLFLEMEGGAGGKGERKS